MFNRFVRLFNTLKYLKFKQIIYRIHYMLRAKLRKALGTKKVFSKLSNANGLKLQESIALTPSYVGQQSFKFLNLSKAFEGEIDWNYAEYGKLWTYNLTYFDFLAQDSEENLSLIESFVDNIEQVNDGLEPFPISLRGINWVKYLSMHNISDQKVNDSLYAQYYMLYDHLEYHLLGNHLLENGYSLLFGAYYFNDETLYQKAKEILLAELEEQVLEDGGHFELSPMYHQIMLFRLLDCINVVKNNVWKERELLNFLTIKAENMLGWLENISYENGDIALLNDSACGIAPHTNELIAYAQRLDITPVLKSLSDSGYRKVSSSEYEAVIDVGEVGAGYIPGHAHADTLNFELRLRGKPFIVDCGTSTYETNERRAFERSTSAHNTVEVNGRNQSDVWGGFRVANRATIVGLSESESTIEATHNGYQPLLHTRRWQFEEDRIIVEDTLSAEGEAVARLHFHPDVAPEEISKYIQIEDHDMRFCTYSFSPEFNKHQNATCVEISFNRSLKVEIFIK